MPSFVHEDLRVGNATSVALLLVASRENQRGSQAALELSHGAASNATSICARSVQSIRWGLKCRRPLRSTRTSILSPESAAVMEVVHLDAMADTVPAAASLAFWRAASRAFAGLARLVNSTFACTVLSLVPRQWNGRKLSLQFTRLSNQDPL